MLRPYQLRDPGRQRCLETSGGGQLLDRRAEPRIGLERPRGPGHRHRRQGREEVGAGHQQHERGTGPRRPPCRQPGRQVSEDGGATWRNLGNRARHVDDHAFWIDPKDTDHLMVGGDGGLYESWDGGRVWRHFTNLSVTQFYNVEVAVQIARGLARAHASRRFDPAPSRAHRRAHLAAAHGLPALWPLHQRDPAAGAGVPAVKVMTPVETRDLLAHDAAAQYIDIRTVGEFAKIEIEAADLCPRYDNLSNESRPKKR